MPEQGSPASVSRNPWAGACLLVLLTAAVYANSLGGPFVFDDVDSIVTNTTIRRLWPPGPVLSPPQNGGLTVEGRPIINLAVAINYAIGGEDVRSYHQLNLAIHIAVGLLLWSILRLTLRRPPVPEAVRGAADGLSWAAAALWLLHPLATSAVTYVIQRAESIMALFYLLTLYALVRAADSARPAAWYACAIAASALGMASKEVMVTAPVMAFLYDRTFLAGSFRGALRRRRALHAALAATWVILLILRGGRSTSAGFGGAVSPLQYGVTQFRFVAHYLRLAFWPDPLVFDYGRMLAGGIANVWPQAVLVTTLVAATAAALRLAPPLGFIGAWFFLVLAPSSSIVPVHTQTGAEHRMYLPLASVVVGSVLAGHWLWRRWVARALGPAASRGLGLLIVAALIATLGAGTVRRNRDYRTSESLWTSVLAVYPDHARAHFNLGGQRREAGDMAGAREHYLRTVEKEPDFPFAYLNLGCVHATLGQHEEAIAAFDRAAALEADDPRNYLNRALSEYALRRYDAAVTDLDRVIRASPSNENAHYMHGLAQRQLGRTREAVESYTRALQLNPRLAPALIERAVASTELGQYDQAWADVQKFRLMGGAPDPAFLEALSKASGRAP